MSRHTGRMGFLGRLFRNEPLTPALVLSEPDPGQQFATDIDSGVLYGTLAAPEPWGVPTKRVSRAEAMQVPAVKRARDLICGTIGQMPLHLVGPDGTQQPWNLFGQPEAGVPRSVSMTRLAEDLLFEQRGWWRVTHEGWHNRPAEVIRLDPTSVTIRPDWKVYYTPTGNGVATEWLPDSQVIRFDSPNDALLVAGARAIRSLTRLEQAALNAAEGVPPMDWFTPTDNTDPADDEDIVEFLDAWGVARKYRRTAYVPAALDYHTNANFNPEQLQMQQARDFAVTEIARITGIDAEELSVSTTSRTYQNMQDRRRHYLDFVVGPYLSAIEDRLSMDDVSPHGYTARFDTTTFLRADDKTRAETDVALIEAGVMSPTEARAARGLTGEAPAIPSSVEAADVTHNVNARPSTASTEEARA